MIIDLRSDTVTKPGKGMLDAMMNADVGDDVFAEDPTVLKLEKKACELFGMEAGLFCPSGTMTNQVAIKVHTQPGDELLCDKHSHIYNYEGGGIAFNSGVQSKILDGDRGRINTKQVLENINPVQDWLTRTSLVCIENTVNRAGGSMYELNEMKELSKVCKDNKLKFHLDGARIFNALVEHNYSAKDVGGLMDSVSICLSKGLGAPAGSVLLGKSEFIKNARRVRKVFGGGMRQAGFIAAAGVYALDNNVKRLTDDHKRAKEIGNVLSLQSYVRSVEPVETNIIIFALDEKISGDAFVKKLANENIKAVPFGGQNVRFVTHLDFTDEMLTRTIEVLKKIS